MFSAADIDLFQTTPLCRCPIALLVALFKQRCSTNRTQNIRCCWAIVIPGIAPKQQEADCVKFNVHIALRMQHVSMKMRLFGPIPSTVRKFQSEVKLSTSCLNSSKNVRYSELSITEISSCTLGLLRILIQVPIFPSACL